MSTDDSYQAMPTVEVPTAAQSPNDGAAASPAQDPLALPCVALVAADVGRDSPQAPARVVAPAVLDDMPATPEYILPSPLYKTPDFPTPDESIAADTPVADRQTPRSPPPAPPTRGTPSTGYMTPAQLLMAQSHRGSRTHTPLASKSRTIAKRKKTNAATPSRSRKKDVCFSLSGVAEIGKRQRPISAFFSCPSAPGDRLVDPVEDDVFEESNGESSQLAVQDLVKAEVEDLDQD